MDNDEEANGEINDVRPKTWDKRNELKGLLIMVRMFAFLVLDCANECGNAAAHLHSSPKWNKDKERGEKAEGNMLRLMKVGIKTGRDCLSTSIFLCSQGRDRAEMFGLLLTICAEQLDKRWSMLSKS